MPSVTLILVVCPVGRLICGDRKALSEILIVTSKRSNWKWILPSAIVFSLALNGGLLLPAAIAGDWGYDDSAPSNAKQNNGQTSPAPKGSSRAKIIPLPPVSIPPTTGRAVRKGPFSTAETHAGTYGVQLNPAEYERESAAGLQTMSGDDEDQLHGKVPTNANWSTKDGGKQGTQPKTSAKSSSQGSNKPSATAKASAGMNETEAMVAECWQQLFELAGNSKLSDDQVQQLRALIVSRMNGGAQSAGEAKAILSFWPKVTSYLVSHPQQKENYGQLLRSLLRWRARMQSQDLADAKLNDMATRENDLIVQVLGPVRVAVQAEPPFTEEAVNAYSDMACFVYEQRNPGRSLDASDNREIFANVVCEKFKNAPTEKDRLAMIGFDLTWAKFKIAWEESDNNTRGILLSKLAGSGAGVAWAQVKDPLLEQILGKWPAPKSAPPVEPMLAKAQSYADVKKQANSSSSKPKVSPASAAAATRHK